MIILPKTNFNFATRFINVVLFFNYYQRIELQISKRASKRIIHTRIHILNTSWKKNIRNREMWNAKKEGGKNEKNRGFATYVETRKDRSVDWNVRKIYSSLDTHSRADRSRRVRNICPRDASWCTFPPISFHCAFPANRECTMEDTARSFLTFRLSLIYLLPPSSGSNDNRI